MKGDPIASLVRKGNRSNIFVSLSFKILTLSVWAKVYMFQKLMTLVEVDRATVYSIDTDCFFFAVSRGAELSSIAYSRGIGQFKKVYGQSLIIGYYTTAVKSYMIAMVSSGGGREQICKVKGRATLICIY